MTLIGPLAALPPGYALHTLTESDIPRWTEFCASCFSYKPNPPPASYFARHFFNDPLRDASLVRVIHHHRDVESEFDADKNEDNGGEDLEIQMVASTRVFTRLISSGRSSSPALHAGGIGEVCTAASHRKKGLAKALLLSSIQAMIVHQNVKFQCSLLHASPALTEVYKRSANYQCVPSYWSVVHIYTSMSLGQSKGEGEREDYEEGRTNSLMTSCGSKKSFNIRLASFPSDTLSLKRIHKAYSEDRFAGCIIRSEEYWNEYLSQEIGDSLFVFSVMVDKDNDRVENENENESSTIVGWISVRQRSDTRLQLRDFGMCKKTCQELGIKTSMVFPRLLKQVVQGTTLVTNDSTIELHLPTVVLNEMKEEGMNQDNCPWIDWTRGIQEENDSGWMYKSLQNACSDDEVVDMVKIVEEQNIPHLIWPADSF